MEPTACPSTPHTHVTPDGLLVKCYHKCKTGALSVKQVLGSTAFWIGSTVTFPLEHFLYEKVWPFVLIKDALGL